MSVRTTIEFWIYLVILIPSIICSLFVLYHLLFDRILRRALHNHVIIVLVFICLICQVTIYPWMLYYHVHNYWERSHIFCSIWVFIDWGLYITQTAIYAWASIERHILIFHDTWVATRKKRFFVHYLPLILLLLYCIIFYSIICFFPSCTNIYNNDALLCVSSCLFKNHFALNMWEAVAHQILPNLIIIMCSIGLLIRVIRQKQRMRRVIQWRKHRKMTIQLLLISFLYLLLSFPNMIMVVMHVCVLPRQIGYEVKLYFEFFSYFVILLFPFVCILPLPELRNKCMKILFLKRPRRLIHPEIIMKTNHMNIQNNHQLANIGE